MRMPHKSADRQSLCSTRAYAPARYRLSRQRPIVGIGNCLSRDVQPPNTLCSLQAQYTLHMAADELQPALDKVYQVLIKSSMLGGFSHHWHRLNQSSADWNAPLSPAQYFRNALKALALLRLQQNDLREAQQVLQTLKRIDPEDRVGAAAVTRQLERFASGGSYAG